MDHVAATVRPLRRTPAVSGSGAASAAGRTPLTTTPVTAAPPSGWRRAVYAVSGGTINTGPSAAQRRRADLDARIDAPLTGNHLVAVAGMKGGVGKSTVTLTLGHAFAAVRRDRVLAIDANPDAGVLAERVTRASAHRTATVHDLLASARWDRFADVREHTLQASTGLHVLGSHDDPAGTSELRGEDVAGALSLIHI